MEHFIPSLERIVRGLRDAWNGGDPRAWASHFAERAVFVDVLGRAQLGRAVIEQEHAKIFETIYRDSTLAITAERAEHHGENLLLTHTTSVLEVPSGPRAGTTHAVQTMLLQANAIVAFQNTIATDPAIFTDHDDAFAARSPMGWKNATN